MAKTVLGLFQEKDDVESVVKSLKNSGFDPQDVSLMMKDKKEAKDIKNDTGADVASGAASGATTGAIIGGIAGLLSSFMLPGLGAIFIGGPLAAALGLTGTAATTVSGAATGAVAGGLIGALTNLGLSRKDAKYYEDRVREGAILVAVPAYNDEVSDVEDLFDRNNASDVRTLEGALGETLEEGQSPKLSQREEDFSQSYSAVKGGEARRNRRRRTTR